MKDKVELTDSARNRMRAWARFILAAEKDKEGAYQQELEEAQEVYEHKARLLAVARREYLDATEALGAAKAQAIRASLDQKSADSLFQLLDHPDALSVLIGREVKQSGVDALVDAKLATRLGKSGYILAAASYGVIGLLYRITDKMREEDADTAEVQPGMEREKK